MPKLIITGPLETLERLFVEDLLHKRAANAFSIECSNADITPALAKGVANAVAFRLAAEQFCWPVSRESLIEVAQRGGIRRATAKAAADQLHAEGSIRDEAEQLSSQQAAEFVTARLSTSPYLRISGVRPADAAAPDAPAEAAGPPQHENPTSEGGYPVLPEQNIHELAAAGVSRLPREETIVIGGYEVAANTPPRERARLEALNDGPLATPAPTHEEN